MKTKREFTVHKATLESYIRETKLKLQRIIGEAQSAYQDLKQLESALETLHDIK